jgi:hypothetical protein
MASSTPLGLPDDVSRASCNSILQETIGLISRTSPHTFETQQRLNYLLSSSFQNNAEGAAFRSILCTGSHDTPVSIEQLNQFVIWPSTNFQFQLQATTHITFQFQSISLITRSDLQQNIIRPAYAKAVFVLNQVVLQHPLKDEIHRFLYKTPPASWKNAILGIQQRTVLKSIDIPSFEELQSRIEKSFDFAFSQKHGNPNSKFFSAASGRAWFLKVPPPVTVHINYEELYIEASSKFSDHLGSLLDESGLYLDGLAGVTVSQSYPEVEARIQKLMNLSTTGRRVVGHDLKRNKTSEKLGGSVCAIHEYLSARFLAYYTVDHDASCAYMVDIRSAHKKDRKIRFSSVKHVNTQPLWVQFGDKNDVYLYLSQKASVAEEAWLTIVNYIMKLLVDFVNAYIKQVHGQNISKDKLLRTKIFTELVNGIAHPLDGNYGPHGDDRSGTVSRNDPQFSRFMLTVPTLCLQNYAQHTTKISWCPRTDPKWVAGIVWQFFCLIHIQLFGVQEYYLHHVRVRIPSFLHWVSFL